MKPVYIKVTYTNKSIRYMTTCQLTSYRGIDKIELSNKEEYDRKCN